ncbi:PIN domain-containing protein [Methylobacterium sp. 10]|uniref:PIN domain-containing protein n=1 Tax=Methylobacterium sp. 10 TaxID=1101191 RepID=UPI0004B19C47|nr:PIN domain-containing protein [Methylobacterium sp. 10]
MTRYLLDTNVISDIVKPTPSPLLTAWLADRPDSNLFIASLTVAEIRRGILEMPSGRKRDDLEAWFSGKDGPVALFAGRTLSFDGDAALVWARLMAEGRRAGRPRSALDMIIAAIAQVNDCVVVTANERDFIGLTVINPTRQAPEDRPA